MIYIDSTEHGWAGPSGRRRLLIASVGMVTLDGEEYLTVDEAAALLGVKRETLYAYVSQGIKRQRLYRRAEVAALIRLDRGVGPAIPHAEDWIRD